jgi:hypothetical protein
MWPSLETANRISGLANSALIFSLASVALFTILVAWMANVKEAYWDADRQASNEHIADLANKTASAQKEAAHANERAAFLMKEASARFLDSGQQKVLGDSLKKTGAKVKISYPVSDTEAAMYASDIANSFRIGQWVVTAEPFVDTQIWMGLTIFETRYHDADAVATAFTKVGLKGFGTIGGKSRTWGALTPSDVGEMFVSPTIKDDLELIVGSKRRFLPGADLLPSSEPHPR